MSDFIVDFIGGFILVFCAGGGLIFVDLIDEMNIFGLIVYLIVCYFIGFWAMRFGKKEENS